MLSSTSHRIVCVLIILSTAVCAHSQYLPAKEPTGVVTGKVTLKGKPAADIVIVLRPNSPNPTAQFSSHKGTTDLNGECRIANVPAGNYTVAPVAPALVDANGFSSQKVVFLSKGETIENIDFALVRGGAITGKVVDADGRPLIEQEIQLFAVQNNSSNYSMTAVQTDDRGIYRFYGFKAGSYKVATGRGERGSFSNRFNFYKQTYYPSVSEADQATVIEVSEGGEAANIDITVGPTLTSYTASGRIVDGATGQPLPGVAYGIKRFISAYSTSSMSNGAVTNSRGEFKLENLVPGKYAVQIRPVPTNTWRADDLPFEIVDEDVSGLVVQTKKGATLSGVVVIEGSDDKNARNELRRLMLIAISGPRDERASNTWSAIGADGSFSMSGVAPGLATLQLANSSHFRLLRVERNGVIPGRGVDVKEGEELSGVRVFVAFGNATIRGSVEVPNGTLPSGARYYVVMRNISDDQMVASGSNLSAEVDARGQFVIEGVFPGTYEISAGIWSPDGRTVFGEKKQQIAVTAGSVNNVTLSIELNPKTTRP